MPSFPARIAIPLLALLGCGERTYLILEQRPPQPESLASIVVAVRASGGDSVRVWTEGGRIVEQKDSIDSACFTMPLDGPLMLSIATSQDEVIVHADLFVDTDCADGELVRSVVRPMRPGEDDSSGGGGGGGASPTSATSGSSATDATGTGGGAGTSSTTGTGESTNVTASASAGGGGAP